MRVWILLRCDIGESGADAATVYETEAQAQVFRAIGEQLDWSTKCYFDHTRFEVIEATAPGFTSFAVIRRQCESGWTGERIHLHRWGAR